MLDDDQLDDKIRTLIIDLLMVLHRNGLPKASVGGLMRLIGVSDKVAREHDDEVIELTDEFAKYISQLDTLKSAQQDNKFLH